MADFDENGINPLASTRCTFLIGIKQFLKTSPSIARPIYQAIPTGGSLKDILHPRGNQNSPLFLSFGSLEYYSPTYHPGNLRFYALSQDQSPSTGSIVFSYKLEVPSGQTVLSHLTNPKFIYSLYNFPIKASNIDGYTCSTSGKSTPDFLIRPLDWVGNTHWNFAANPDADYAALGLDKLNSIVIQCTLPKDALPPYSVAAEIAQELSVLYNLAAKFPIWLISDGLYYQMLVLPYDYGTLFFYQAGPRPRAEIDAYNEVNGLFNVNANVQNYFHFIVEDFTTQVLLFEASTAHFILDLPYVVSFGDGAYTPSLTFASRTCFLFDNHVDQSIQEPKAIDVGLYLYGSRIYIIVSDGAFATDGSKWETWIGLSLQCSNIPFLAQSPTSDDATQLIPFRLRMFTPNFGEFSFSLHPNEQINTILDWTPTYNDLVVTTRSTINIGLKSQITIKMPRTSMFLTQFLEKLYLTYPGINFKHDDGLKGYCSTVHRTGYDFSISSFNQLLMTFALKVSVDPLAPNTLILSEPRGLILGWQEISLRSSVNYLICEIDLIVDSYESDRDPGVLQYGDTSQIWANNIPFLVAWKTKTLGQFPAMFELSATSSLTFVEMSRAQTSGLGLSINTLPTIVFNVGSTSPGIHYLYSPFTYFSVDQYCRQGNSILASIRRLPVSAVDFPSGLTATDHMTGETTTINPQTLFEISFNPSATSQFCAFTAVSLYNTDIVNPKSVFFKVGRENLNVVLSHPALTNLSPGVLFDVAHDTVDVTIFNSKIKALDEIIVDIFKKTDDTPLPPKYDTADYSVTFTNFESVKTANSIRQRQDNMFNMKDKDFAVMGNQGIDLGGFGMFSAEKLKHIEPYRLLAETKKRYEKVFEQIYQNEGEFSAQKVDSSQSSLMVNSGIELNEKLTKLRSFLAQNSTKNNKNNTPNSQLTTLQTVNPIYPNTGLIDVPVTRIHITFSQDVVSNSQRFSLQIPTTLPSTQHPLTLGSFSSQLNGLSASLNTLLRQYTTTHAFGFTVKPNVVRGGRDVTPLNIKLTPGSVINNGEILIDLFEAALPIINSGNNKCYLQITKSTETGTPVAVQIDTVYTQNSRYVLSIKLPDVITPQESATIECYMDSTRQTDLGVALTAILSQPTIGLYNTASATARTSPNTPKKPVYSTSFTLLVQGTWRENASIQPPDDITYIVGDWIIESYPELGIDLPSFGWKSWNVIDSFVGSSAFVEDGYGQSGKKNPDDNADTGIINQHDDMEATSIVDNQFENIFIKNGVYSFQTQASDQVEDVQKLFAKNSIKPKQLTTILNDVWYQQSIAHLSELQSLQTTALHNLNYLPLYMRITQDNIFSPTAKTNYDQPSITTDPNLVIQKPTVALATYFNATITVRVPPYLTPDHITSLFRAIPDKKIIYNNPNYSVTIGLNTDNASQPNLLVSEGACSEGNECGAGCEIKCGDKITCSTDFDCQSRFCRTLVVDGDVLRQNRLDALDGKTVFNVNDIIIGSDRISRISYCDVNSHRTGYFLEAVPVE
jgi:hypothetical protein